MTPTHFFLSSPPSSASSASLRLIVLSLALLLPACKVGPNYSPHQTQTPDAWLTDINTTQPATAPTTQPIVDLAQWWTSFNDPTLNSLVDRAIAGNLDLRLAETRVRQARAARGVVVSGLFPSVNADAAYSHASSAHSVASSYRAGLDAAWEIDIFGGTRRSIEAADSDIQAAVEDRRDALVTLTSELALNYLDLRGSQEQLFIARQNLDLQKKNADITHRRFADGLASGLDTASADAQVANTASQIPLLESSIRQTIYIIATLLGREPGALVAELTPQSDIPVAPPSVPLGLPSELLLRRPDIRAAQERIHAATARIGVAVSDLYPKFSLTGTLGLSSSDLSSFLNWSSRFGSIGPSVTWNIFSAGRITSNIELQRAVQEQSFITYQLTVLTALQEVESALVAYNKELEHRAHLEDAVTANAKAVDLATKLYTAGQADYLTVLVLQQALFNTQDALAQSNRTLSTTIIALFKALGGGWTPE